ncbi:ABC transporter substrate-binding protein [Muricaecibacterium torontonense]|uniref:ABC transporter substrate-binding protein n=1 Tax=Muricaecibacterium torontonense TaxID=3032871 RepID=A0A4S2F077_9ACTN|nr:ABC transporter substrate-binding protein [Muricaecibacterium torontonense]TGY62258.1 ABC transporter substrate-binding protein [Muricaecibacterium torontonense]
MFKKGMTRRTFVGLSGAAAAVAGLGLVGCGGTDDSSTSTEGGSDPNATLTAGLAYQNQGNLDPLSTSSATGMAANWCVAEGFFEFDYAKMEAYKALAAEDELTKVSDTEYTVKLRKDAKFSDGTAVTPDDVIKSWQRAAGKDEEYAGNIYVPMLSFIENVEADGEDGVKFTLNVAFDPEIMKKRLCIIKVCPASMSKDDLTKLPIGTGPWKYDSSDPQSIKLSVNENYNGDRPASNPVEFSVLVDNDPRVTAMTEGTTMICEAVPADQIDNFKNQGITVDEVQGFNLPFFMFNTKKKPFDDYRVRQAFFYAVDTEKLIENALSGLAKPATCYLPENFPGYHKASTVYTYDVDKAKSLLDEAGAAGTSLTLQTTDTAWIKDIAAQIQQDLQAAGLNVELNSQKSSDLYANQATPDASGVCPYDVVLASGDPSVFGNDPDLLMSWFYGDGIWTQSRYGWQEDPKCQELQALMAKAVTQSGSEQQDTWNQCFDLIAEQVPLYPLLHRVTPTGVWADKIDGFQAIGCTGVDLVGCKAK